MPRRSTATCRGVRARQLPLVLFCLEFLRHGLLCRHYFAVLLRFLGGEYRERHLVTNSTVAACTTVGGSRLMATTSREASPVSWNGQDTEAAGTAGTTARTTAAGDPRTMTTAAEKVSTPQNVEDEPESESVRPTPSVRDHDREEQGKRQRNLEGCSVRQSAEHPSRLKLTSTSGSSWPTRTVTSPRTQRMCHDKAARRGRPALRRGRPAMHREWVTLRRGRAVSSRMVRAHQFVQ